MFSNASTIALDSQVTYPITDSSLPFSQYIAKCREIITARRMDLDGPWAQTILEANSPFEYLPVPTENRASGPKRGALLIHGLLDCPFSLRDIAKQLQAHDILSRAILLPGHGTRPADLLHISYHDWIQAVRYGVETLKKEVDDIYLIGYSTGATLSVYQAQNDIQIKGIILLSPAIKIKLPVDLMVAWHQLTAFLTKSKLWVYVDPEIDYTKYHSIAFNPVTQVSKLTAVIRERLQQQPFTTPIFMALSREDETISSHRAIDFFSSLHNKESKMLLYSSLDHRYPDSRIETRLSRYPELHIQHFSHTCTPFASNNSHYGQTGDYPYASLTSNKNVVIGAYNRIERQFFNLLYQAGLVKNKRQELTYNPDFDYMAKRIVEFIG